MYNRSLEQNSIPNSVISIEFGSQFNRIIKPNILPNSIRKIFFGDKYNKILTTNVIPESVKYIKFGYDFSQSLINLPDTIETIELVMVREPTINTLPMIKHLIIGFLNQNIINNLPISLESISIMSFFEN